MLVLDYEKARGLVLSALEGKVSTVTATRVILALKGATIEAAPVVHGRWRKYHRWNCGIKKDDGFTAGCCGRWNKVQTAYCPNCGARMDGDGNA